ncbi:MAG: LysR family transcriptional regulator [Frisingicoccus sp.]
MDIKNLNTFILVAELNSFTKAAEKLGYSQSTISFQIKQFERELNFSYLSGLTIRWL